MSTDPQDFYRRLRARREAFRVSIEQAADWADLDPERWRTIESGAPLTAVEIGQIGRALAVDPGVLMRGEEQDPRRTVARFRQALPAEGTTAEELRTLALASHLGRVGGGLQRRLNRPSPLLEVRQPIPVAEDEVPWRQGYRLGEKARRSLPIPAGPIIDLQATLESFGVHVATLPFSDASTEAASLMEPGAMPVVLLNSRSDRVRQSLARRATLAHELCHLLHDAGEHDLETRVSRTDAEGDEEQAIEQRARGFAPAFLAPREDVRHWFDLGGGADLEEPEERVRSLAERWGFSWEGACWHAKNFGVIDPARATALANSPGPSPTWHERFEPSARRERPVPPVFEAPDSLSPVATGTLSNLVESALAGDILSAGRAREILAWG